jgi:hypothetical protein
VAGSAIATAVGTASALFIVRRLIDIGVTAQLMTFCRPMLAMLPAGAILWLANPAVLAARGPVELFAHVIAAGLLYLLAYALSTMLLWHLAGRPAGLEQHLLRILCTPFARRRPDAAMEVHVK